MIHLLNNLLKSALKISRKFSLVAIKIDLNEDSKECFINLKFSCWYNQDGNFELQIINEVFNAYIEKT